MPESDDIALLKEFAEDNSEAAFTALVERHVNLVYSTALRSVGNAHAAQEISQAVFIILARKAKSLGAKTILSGWLYQTTRLTAANHLRGEIRRRHREQEAYMQSTLNEPAQEAWPQIAPVLDDAMGRLGEKDRNAIVLRFFENKNLSEVGAALGASEDAAKMRVNRALEKLRRIFAKRGVNSTTAMLGGAIAANSIHAAPIGLAKTISTVAIVKGAAAGSSTLALVKGALKIMAWTKAKMAIAVTAGVLLTAGTATIVVEKIAASSSAPKLPKVSATDLSWADDPRYWATDSRVLGQIPPEVYIFRPTRFAKTGGGVWIGDRMSAKNCSVSELVNVAYGFSYTRTILPPAMPREHFDVMSTVAGGYSERVKNELKTRFHLTAHTETRPADVLLLKVQNPNPPGLKPHSGDGGISTWVGGNRKTTIRNQEFKGFYSDIESRIGRPVINETGLTGKYDLEIQWQPRAGESDKDAYARALREQLGLELVPANRPIEMLVVEKAK